MVNRFAGVGDAECYVLFAAVKLSPYDTSAFGIFYRIVKQYRHKLYYTVTVAAEPDVILDCAKGKINANEFTGIVANLKESGLKPQAMSDYLHNSEKISFEDAQKTRSAMYNAFKEIEPELTDEQFADRITEIRDELS